MKLSILLLRILLCGIFCVFLSSCKNQQLKKVTPSNQVLNSMPEHFLSFAIDLAQIAGGKWWEGSSDFSMGRGGKSSDKLDFNREKLIALTKSLSPAIIRAGGSEADSIFYGLDESESVPSGFQTILSKATWDSFYEFTRVTKNLPLFTLNIGPGYRKDYELTFDHFHKFFSYLKDHQQKVTYFELGNELNAFFLNYGPSSQVSAKKYAGEYLKVKEILHHYFPRAKLLGPANAFWPFLGEVFSSFSTSSKDIVNFLKKNLDILSWHYYPTQSHRCPINVNRATEFSMTHPTTIDSITKISEDVKSLTKPYNLESWLGETGPAQCGGEPLVSTSFSSALWWIDFIGKISKTNNKVMIRQTLIGSDYGIIDNDSLNIRHDFLSSYLFKSLHINYSLQSDGDNEHVYSYCSKNQFHHLLIVNMKDREINYDISDFVAMSPYHGLFMNEQISQKIINSVNDSHKFDQMLIDKSLSRIALKNVVSIEKRSYAIFSSRDKSPICSALVLK